jgi:hypothetical protein
MSDERDWPDPDLPQDPGIPGSKTPQQLPPEDEPEVERVPDAEQPDADDEGHMAPAERDTPSRMLVSRSSASPRGR